MRILLVASTDSDRTLEKIVGLSTASADRGHEVTVFFNSTSVLLLMPETRGGLRELASRGVHMLVCRTSALDHGLPSSEAMMEGASMSSMGGLVELLEECDRALFVG